MEAAADAEAKKKKTTAHVGRQTAECRLLAVLLRPSLWATALRQAVRLAPKRWWARQPRLPAPEAEYLRFRSITAYGDPDRAPEPEDVVTWLSWCRAWGPVTKVPAASGPHD